MKMNTNRINFQAIPRLNSQHNIFDKTSFSALDIGSPITVADSFVEPQACSTRTQDAASTAGTLVVFGAVSFVGNERSCRWTGGDSTRRVNGSIGRVNDGTTNSLHDPRDKLGNFGENSGLLRACAGAERHNADDVEATSTVAAHQRTTRITHASRPDSGIAKADGIRRFVLAPFLRCRRCCPDLAINLLQCVSWCWWISYDESPSREVAVTVAAVVLSGGRKTSSADIRAAEVGVLGKLQESDVVLELLWAVELRVNVDAADGNVALGSVAAFKMPFAGTNLVRSWVLALSKAMGSAEHPSFVQQSSTADVHLPSWAIELKGNLPGELAVARVNATDDSRTVALPSALIGGSGGNDA